MLILITRPRYDLVTHYLYYWGDFIIKEAKQRHLPVIDLEQEKASKKLIESYLNKQKPDIVILNGHGNDTCVTGQEEEVLIKAGDNSHLLKDKVVYARTCDSAKILGPQAVKEGAKAFIGHEELFRFWTDRDSVKNPLKDEYAQPFLKTSNQVAVSLLKGKRAKQSHEDSLKVYERVISELLTNDVGNSFVVVDLIWNMRHQVCLEK